MKRSLIFVILCVTSALLVLSLSCSKKEQEADLLTGPDLSGIKSLTITPATGIPGTIVTVSGYLIESNMEEQYGIWIGDNFAPFSLDSDSTISVMLPLFLGADGWPVPSTEPMTVELRRNDTLVAHAVDAITIKALPKAPGSTQKAQVALESVASSIDALWILVPPEQGIEQPLREAIGAMLRGLLLEGDSSLTAILNGSSSLLTDPQKDLELIDAMLASSGALDYLEAYAGGLANLQQKAQKAVSSGSAGSICRSGGADIDLACKMQLYVLLKDYAEVFVHPTAQIYANTVGLLAAAIAVSGVGVPAAAVVGAILTVADFVMGKLVPSLFPARITVFDLQVQPDTIPVGGITNSTIMISASNNPETISLSDLVNLLLSTVGAKGPRSTEFAENFITILINTADFVFNLYKSILETYNTDNPGTFIDPSFLMPAMTWGPIEVTSPDMVEKFSFTPDIIIAEEGEGYEWRGLKKGEGRIQARTRAAGERSKVVKDNSIWLGISWTGGAFGNEISHSETKTVVVGKPGKLEVIITGLPDGVPAAIYVTGPNFSGFTVKDTIFDDLEAGTYSVTAGQVSDGTGAVYKPNPKDQQRVVHEGQTTLARFKYYQKIIMTVLIGGKRNNYSSGQAISWAEASFSHSYDGGSNSDIDNSYVPELEELPELTGFDSCLFEEGRRLMTGAEPFFADASTNGASANMDVTIDVQEDLIVITWSGRVSSSVASTNGTFSSNAKASFSIERLLSIELDNRSDTGGGISYTWEISFQKDSSVFAPSGFLRGSQSTRLCGGFANSFSWFNSYVQSIHPDTTFSGWGGMTIPAGSSREAKFNLLTEIGSRCSYNDGNTENPRIGGIMTVEGRFEIKLNHVD